MNVANFITTARRMCHVSRCAGTPLIKNYSVTEHCAQAAILYVAYCEHKEETPNSNLLQHILLHDILEVFSGDMLWPAKHLNLEAWEQCEEAIVDHVRDKHDVELSTYDDNNFMSVEDKHIWQACDSLELYLKMAEEVRMGNKSDEVLEILQVSYDLVEKTGLQFFQAMRDSMHWEVRKHIKHLYAPVPLVNV